MTLTERRAMPTKCAIEISKIRDYLKNVRQLTVAAESIKNEISKLEKANTLIDKLSDNGESEIKETIQRRTNDLEEILVKKLRLEGYLERLPPIERQILYENYVNGTPMEAIAFRNHVSRATIYRKKGEALKLLAKIAEEDKFFLMENIEK